MDTKVEQSWCTPANVRAEQAWTFCVELSRGLVGDERLGIAQRADFVPKEDKDGVRQDDYGWTSWPFNADDMKATQRKTVLRGNHNIYATICALNPSPIRSKTGIRMWRRQEKHVAAGLALMVDDLCDDEGGGLGNKGALSVSELSAKLPPTCVVCTSPGNYQAWYFFDAPERDTAKFKRFIASFVDQVLTHGGDKLNDPTRYGRVPFGINNKLDAAGKPKYADADGRVPNVWLVSADYTKRYSIDTICAAFGVEIVVPEARAAAQRDAAADDHWLDQAVFDAAVEAYKAAGQLRRSSTDGKYRIRCHWEHEHSGAHGDMSAVIWCPDAGMDNPYGWHCSHTTCIGAKRTWAAFVAAFLIEREESVTDALAAVNESACGRECWPWMEALLGLKVALAAYDEQAMKEVSNS